MNTGAQINTIRQLQDSIRSLAAGAQGWAPFIDLVNFPYFLPLAVNVPKWIALFNPGRTFSLYLSHLCKARQLLNIPPSWYTTAAMVLAMGGGRRSRFQPQIWKLYFQEAVRETNRPRIAQF